MRLLKQAVAVLGSVVVITVIVALVTPKTAHAVIATAVQVVNSVANPAGTEDVSRAASQIVELACVNFSGQPGAIFGCFPVIPFSATINGLNGAYTVPPNQNFVITSVEVDPSQSVTGNILVVLQQATPQVSGFAGREGWTVNAATTTVLDFPTSGIVFPSGVSISMSAFYEASPSPGSDPKIVVRGYLTTN
jgi:hypothetical protein